MGDAESAEVDQRVEKAGPLAGLRGILPAEDLVSQYRKLPVYSAKLRVTEKQRGHAALLDSLLAQETQPLVIPPTRSHAPGLILRVLVALMLFVVLGGMLLTNVQLLPMPGLYPPEVLAMYDQIEALPENAPVLLAVDYEPGLSGEMRFAASMVMDHLMQKQARLAIISTVPTGPVMADALLREANAVHPDYDLAGQVENLGYLPGGTISILEFARSPRQAAPQTFFGEPAWSQPTLADVEQIQDFTRIIVLTDRAEAGRAWVEQVQPYLGNVPLLMVASAQAAPMLEPYVESNQVQGMVSGLMGGTLYGQRAGRQDVNIAQRYWSTYQLGMMLVILLVLCGGVYSGLASMVNRQRKVKG